MKKLLFALLLCVSCFSESLAQASSGGTESSLIYIDWGRKSKECKGFGICDIKIKVTTADTFGLVSMILTGGIYIPNVEIVFDRQYYDSHKAQFVNGYLVIEEDYVLSSEVTRALKAPGNLKIKAGKYKVNFNASTNKYSCTF